MRFKTAYLKIEIFEGKYTVTAFHFPTWWHEQNKNFYFTRDDTRYITCIVSDYMPDLGVIKIIVAGFHVRSRARMMTK